MGLAVSFFQRWSVLKGGNFEFPAVIQSVCCLGQWGIRSKDNSYLTAYIFNLQHFSLIYSLVFKVLLVLLQPSYCTLTSKSYFLSRVLPSLLGLTSLSLSRVLPSLSLYLFTILLVLWYFKELNYIQTLKVKLDSLRIINI